MQEASRAGSSPRMRGAQMYASQFACLERIIPADAGSTHLQAGTQHHDPDHPRGCGEHFCMWRLLWHVGGSSPRMRGARCLLRLPFVRVRIIPADAGSTGRGHTDARLITDHPRGCGEHPDRRRNQCFQLGSSPRMRGALPGDRPIHAQAGIIPADAGSTWRRVLLAWAL